MCLQRTWLIEREMDVLQWYGHEERMEEDGLVKKATKFSVSS